MSNKKWFSAVVLVLALTLAAATASAVELVPAGKVIVTTGSARGMDLSRDDQVLYVGGIQDRTLVKLDTASGKVETFDLTKINSGAYGKTAWVDGNGKIWMALTLPILAKWSPDLTLEASWDLKEFGLVTTEGALVTPNGDIYVTDRNTAKPGIFKFREVDGKLVPVTDWGNNGYIAQSDLRLPNLTPDNDILLNVYGTSEIWLVKADTGAKSLYLSGIFAPYFIDQDDSGRIWVCHYDKEPSVSVYAADGVLIRSWSKAELGITMESAGIAVSKDGTRLYVADQRNPGVGGAVLIFDVK
ncbi:MAG TPA: hypothetical protein GXZ82_03440 [Firmicutes bacterium]|jgi:DNA-binding beta-propeller fold protein YncE|nr:hypothetical protein [Bacillota bacterium]